MVGLSSFLLKKKIKLNLNVPFCIFCTFVWSSCASTPIGIKSESKKEDSATTIATTSITKNNGSSESVREVYLRMKNRDLSEKEIAEEEDKSAEVAKISSRNMIEGASVISGDAEDNAQLKGKIYYLEGAEELNLENNYFDIPVVYNDQVKKWISYFLNRGRPFFERYAERAGRYAPILGAILEEHGLPRDLIFLAMAESGFNNKAKSWAKAVGPWQFMPYTGKMYGLDQDWYRDERRDPIKATVAASRYLTKLYDDFGSWELAAAGYNAGEGKISRAIRKYNTDEFWGLTKGRYLKDETKNYVPKIMALAIIGKNLTAFGFEEIDFHEPLDFDEITVGAFTDLYKLSDVMGIELEEIQRLNPELLRWFTPPNMGEYKLRLPPGSAEKWVTCCIGQDLKASEFQEFVVDKKRMSISEIAKKFKIRQVDVLANLNQKTQSEVYQKGESIKLPFRLGEIVSPNNNMYADLYEKSRKEILSKNKRYKKKYAKTKGARTRSPKLYVVKKGESIKSVAQKHGISVQRLIASNSKLKKSRNVKAGDKLVVK